MFCSNGIQSSANDECRETIDEAADFQDAILQKINGAKTKSDFRPIREEVEKAAFNFIEKLNSIS